ncbi:MAG: alpha/beta fold hydrolase [Thermoanaerobaculia bacterium]
MQRREFLAWSGATLACAALGGTFPSRLSGMRLAAANARLASDPAPAGAVETATLASESAEVFAASRRFADLPFGRIAYVERGAGSVALFLHGAPLNGFQWRGAMARLAPYRRCIAPDFMGLGYSEVPEKQGLAARDQAAMLVAFLDRLAIRDVDLVASDSGSAVAQLFLVQNPARVRTMILTDGDVEPDSPPVKVKPAIEMARAGTLADATALWLTDTALARSTFGAAVFRNPAGFADETIAMYVAPLVSSPLRRRQYHAFHLALEPNPLAGIEAALSRSQVPVRIVWGESDDIFSMADAEYLDRIFPQSRGIRRVPGGKLFFPEEFPDLIAKEAKKLWGA